jgi:hypothetical protein
MTERRGRRISPSQPLGGILTRVAHATLCGQIAAHSTKGVGVNRKIDDGYNSAETEQGCKLGLVDVEAEAI